MDVERSCSGIPSRRMKYQEKLNTREDPELVWENSIPHDTVLPFKISAQLNRCCDVLDLLLKNEIQFGVSSHFSLQTSLIINHHGR